MKKQINQRWQSVLPAAIATIFLLGAFGSIFAQPGSGAKYGARDPRTCVDKTAPKTGALSSAQAAQYVVCSSEYVINDLYLVENVTVQIGKGRPYNIREDINFPDIDTKFPVYPIRGSLTKYDCGVIYLDRSNLNRNCSVYNHPNAKGACYKDSFGDWKCGMTDASRQLIAENQAPTGRTRRFGRTARCLGSRLVISLTDFCWHRRSAFPKRQYRNRASRSCQPTRS